MGLTRRQETEAVVGEAARLAAWCVERAREFKSRAFAPVGIRWVQEQGLYQTIATEYSREDEIAADNLRAIAKLLRTLNASVSHEQLGA